MSMPDTAEPWPLVGRDLELASFAAAWAARRCQGVVIHGPAGIGKSRLAEECLPRAVRAGFEAGRATASARAAGNLSMAVWLLTDLVRLGGAAAALVRLTEMAETAQGHLVPMVADLARALGDDDPERLLALSQGFAGMGADLFAAEAASAAAAAFRRVGRPRRAPIAARLAEQLATPCEGARTPLLAAEAAAPLTARQRDIAVLAATGVSSKDIAARLQLSVRTVENHLQNAYARLGVTTRAELANALGV
jgi:DNA-binding CsgD family transcriptional regulator